METEAAARWLERFDEKPGDPGAPDLGEMEYLLYEMRIVDDLSVMRGQEN